jgi:hypothetical protein
MVLLVEHVTEPMRISEANTDEGLEGQPHKLAGCFFLFFFFNVVFWINLCAS